MFTHHKLNVYQKALTLSINAESLSSSWVSRRAVKDHFCRASESVVLNIAEGSRLRSAVDKVRFLDYALGSALECAACLDIASIQGSLSLNKTNVEKFGFLEVTRMLVGLRKAWCEGMCKEDSISYQGKPSCCEPGNLFHHETLDVYQVALSFVRWFMTLPGIQELSDRRCREIDKAATSMVLNVAEGNGRYSDMDHRRFLDIAAASAVKAAAHLDLYRAKTIPPLQIENGQELLGRVVAMLAKF